VVGDRGKRDHVSSQEAVDIAAQFHDNPRRASEIISAKVGAVQVDPKLT
jgi:hypothetical protein